MYSPYLFPSTRRHRKPCCNELHKWPLPIPQAIRTRERLKATEWTIHSLVKLLARRQKNTGMEARGKREPRWVLQKAALLWKQETRWWNMWQSSSYLFGEVAFPTLFLVLKSRETIWKQNIWSCTCEWKCKHLKKRCLSALLRMTGSTNYTLKQCFWSICGSVLPYGEANETVYTLLSQSR